MVSLTLEGNAMTRLGIRTFLFAVGFALVIAATAAAEDLPPLPQRGSVSQFGITWTFQQPVAVGQFVNGDYYVVGPVTITAISPAPVYGTGSRNGSTKNPPVSGLCGYDGRITNYFRATLNEPLPIQLAPGDSLISTVSVEVMGNIPNMLRTSDRSQLPLRTAAVLTCLAAQAPSDAFRPSYGDRTGRIYLARNLRRDLLPRLARVPHVPTLATYERVFERPWTDTAWYGFCSPMENMPVYGREVSRGVGMATLLLCSDFATAEKERLLVRFVQVGIDLMGLVRAGHAGWYAHGGHHSGRKWPILFAGIVLGDPEMQRPETYYPQVRFQEDMQTIHGPGWTGATALYAGHYGSQGHPSNPDWGPYEHLQPPDWPGTIGENYRRCCTSIAWIGEALAARILHAEELWNHDAFFDYCDRWMTEDDTEFARIAAAAHPGSESWYTADWARQRQCWDAFVEEMWAAYRTNLPPQAGPAWAIVASHGPLGELASTVGDGYTEPRLAGLRKLRITFTETIDAATAVAGAVSLTGTSSGDVSALVESLTLDAGGHVLTVTLSASPPDGDVFTVAITDVLRTTGGGTVAGDRRLTVRLLAGDIDGSGVVSVGDILAVRAAAGLPLTPQNASVDIDGSGQVSGADLLQVRSRLGRRVP